MSVWGIDALFNPGKRYADEEKLRIRSTRQEIGDSAGGRRIDLESGVVVISRPQGSGEPLAADEIPTLVVDPETPTAAAAVAQDTPAGDGAVAEDTPTGETAAEASTADTPTADGAVAEPPLK